MQPEAMTPSDCEVALAAMTPAEEILFLAVVGHWLTVAARGAYEFQAPGVKDPIALRAFNELHHRVYAQIRSLARSGQRNIDAESMASWLTGENGSPEFQASCLWAFKYALEQVRSYA